MADILFVHTNFPAQFGAIARALHMRGDRCVAIGSRTAGDVPGVRVLRWSLGRGTTPGIWPQAVQAEADLLRAYAVATVADTLAREGLKPDVVIGHPGWGETLFLHEILPSARQILYAEYYYHADGLDVGFDPEFGQPDLAERCRVEAKNATLAMAYARADRLVWPTRFQASTLPAVFQPRISVIYEGVDLDAIRPVVEPRLALRDARTLRRSDEVVTFVNRRFEPMRGFHVFMRALPDFLAARPNAHSVFTYEH